MGRNIRFDGDWYILRGNEKIESHPTRKEAVNGCAILNEQEIRYDRTPEYSVRHKDTLGTIKLFDDMSIGEKLEHIDRCCKEARAEIAKLTYLADILDTYDYWVPWLIEEVRSKYGKKEDT